MMVPAVAFSSSQHSHRALLWALGVSVLLHASLLSLKWASPATYDRLFESSSLEVVLVNARSMQAPENPQALAQVSLAGGGQMAGNTLQSSPLAANSQEQNGLALQQIEKNMATLKQEQMHLIQQLKQELQALNSQQANATNDAKQTETLADRQNQLSRQLALIEKQSQALQGGPKKRYIGPATQEVAYARYYDKMRRTIETTGTENFPQAAGEKLYGSLTMVIVLNDQGKVLSTEVANGSGKTILDQRAQAIVRGAAPFDPFTLEMKRQADQLVVVTRFQFSKDETLATHMLAAPSGPQK
jgi:protein TonB